MGEISGSTESPEYMAVLRVAAESRVLPESLAGFITVLRYTCRRPERKQNFFHWREPTWHPVKGNKIFR